MTKIASLDRSIIPACDVNTLEELGYLVASTCDVKGIGGYKVGAVLAIGYGLPDVVKVVRKHTDLPIIYDHQKGMTDIPDMGASILKKVKDAGVDAFIGFPQSGPATEEAWIKECEKLNLHVIVGGEMTHPKFKVSEGGFIADEKLDSMYTIGASLGVTNFVVPGNKVDRVKHYRELLEPVVGKDLTFWAPGFVAQKGEISETGKVAGDKWHAIVGRGIYAVADVNAAAREMTSKLFLV